VPLPFTELIVFFILIRRNSIFYDFADDFRDIKDISKKPSKPTFKCPWAEVCLSLE